MTRDGLHFVTIAKDDKGGLKSTFAVSAIDRSRSVMDGREVREAIEYERDSYIVLSSNEPLVHFVKRIPPAQEGQ